MFALIGGFLAKSALMSSPIGGFLKAIPRQVWIALAIAATVLAVVLWYNHQIHAAYDRGHKEGVAAENARLAKRAEALTAQIRKKGEDLAAHIRSKNREANDRSNALAAGLVRDGPGRAAYRCPANSAAASGYQPRLGNGDVAASGVPTGDRLPVEVPDPLAVVPWGWLVSKSQSCDLNLHDNQAWNEWYRKLIAMWPKAKPSATVAAGK